jgi:hypothetical protein
VGRGPELAQGGSADRLAPDFKTMGTSGKGTAVVGYNVQTAVDARHRHCQSK